MADIAAQSDTTSRAGAGRDIAFAMGIVFILTILFLPIPPALIDFALAFSIAFSVLILMVALWIEKPLDFSAFPTVLLIATMLRLSLNIATTRLILTNGASGEAAAGHVIAGFSRFVMSGDFIIGVIVFLILVTVNFVVITKGATRIAEVGARFTLDSIPGKQMAVDADLSAGLIDEKESQRRRRELEEESSFFGSMDGASKFVRGDAIAGLIITAVNIIGGIVIGVLRYDMDFQTATDVFTKLSVGDGLVSQVPALIVSLAAGLLVSKGGTRGSADQAVLSQLGNYPRALSVAAGLMFILAITPGLPLLPFIALGIAMGATSYLIPRRLAEQQQAQEDEERRARELEEEEQANSVKQSLKVPDIELLLSKQLGTILLASQSELAHRVSRMRRKFATLFGFVVPEIKLSEDLSVPSQSYKIKIHGTEVAASDLSGRDVLVIKDDRPPPPVPYEEAIEPAFGIPAYRISQEFAPELKNQGYQVIDPISAILTHLSEVIKAHLSLLLSYKDVRFLIDGLDADYQKLVDDICPAHLSMSGLQAVLKLLLAERVSIRNLSLILEAIAEIAPHVNRPEQIVEHVRTRINHQICGDFAQNRVLRVLRLGDRWEGEFHNAIKRNARGEVAEFDMSAAVLEEFSKAAADKTKELMAERDQFVIVTAPDARRFVRMVFERLYPTLPVLSHLEIVKNVEVDTIGSIG